MRPLKKAAGEEARLGRFFLSCPDFALGNFDVDELVTIVLGFIGKDAAVLPPRKKIEAAVSGASSESTFMRALKGVNIDDSEKGVDWGTALMDYALSHPKFPGGHSQQG